MAEGFKDFSAGAVAASSEVDDYLMRQTVMRFASTAARDSALSGVLVEGLVTYQKDTDTVTVYSGSAWATAGSMAAWQSWTPTLGTTTITYAKYRRIWGRGIEFRLKVTWDASTTSSPIEITPPVAVHADYTEYTPIGVGVIVNAGVSRFEGTCIVSSTGSLAMLRSGDYVTNSSVFAFGAGDLFMLSGLYEPAS